MNEEELFGLLNYYFIPLLPRLRLRSLIASAAAAGNLSQVSIPKSDLRIHNSHYWKESLHSENIEKKCWDDAESEMTKLLIKLIYYITT